jgi:hypothetical protein
MKLIISQSIIEYVLLFTFAIIAMLAGYQAIISSQTGTRNEFDDMANTLMGNSMEAPVVGEW